MNQNQQTASRFSHTLSSLSAVPFSTVTGEAAIYSAVMKLRNSTGLNPADRVVLVHHLERCLTA